MRLNMKAAAVALAAAGAFGMAAGSASAATATTNGPLTGVTATASPAATKLLVSPPGFAAIPVRCTSSGASLNLLGTTTGAFNLTVGTNVTPTFTGCTVAGTIPVTVACTSGATLDASGITVGGSTPGQISGVNCTITVSASCTGVATGTVDGSYSNTGVLTIGTTQNLTLTANCPSNVLRSGPARYGSNTAGVTPPGALNYNVTSSPVPNVVVTP